MTVYLSPGIVLAGPSLEIDLGGFWRLRWLRVRGAATVAACAY